MFSPRRYPLALAAAAACLAGCLPGLSVTPLQSAAGKPGNVAVYLKVETNDGAPVASLSADQFTIFEDGARLARADTKQALLSPKLGAAHDTLLLIDVSGTTVGAKEVGEVIKAAAAFTERVQRSQNVAVYTFDGSPDLNAVVPFATLEPPAPTTGETSTTFKPTDPRASLDGGVIAGLKILASALAADHRALKFGTLVVFTDGTRHGTLESAADLRAAMAAPENAKVDIFAVGIGDGIDSTRLGSIGRSGTVTEQDPANVTSAFNAVAAKVVRASGRYYLLSYCTPARSGPHETRIEAHSYDGLIGDFTYRFNADGFGAGCDPNNPTGFDVTHLAEAAPNDHKKDPPKKPVKRPPAAPAAAPSPSPPPAPPPPPARAQPPAPDPFAP